MKFNYQARTQEGEVHSGVIEAASKDAALTLLQKSNLFVTFLEETEEAPLWMKKIRFFERISGKEIMIFARQLSVLFAAKVPLVKSLQTLGFQTANPTFRVRIAEITRNIEAGMSLSKALAFYPQTFSTFFVGVVRSGEASGTISESLGYLADHLEREYTLQSKLRGAMVYPAVVLAVMVVIFSIMVVFVLPNIVSILESIGQELPLITRIVIAFVYFVQKWGWLLAVTMVILFSFLFRYSKTREGSEFKDKYILKAPIIGKFLKMLYLSRFAENLSTLISGGIPIAQALEVSGQIIGNYVYRQAIFTVRDGVKRGEPMSVVFSHFPELFPPVFVQMTLVGEKTGNLDRTLMNVVTFYQREVETSIEWMLGLLEPLLILILGAGVGLMVVSLLMPLYQISAM